TKNTDRQPKRSNSHEYKKMWSRGVAHLWIRRSFIAGGTAIYLNGNDENTSTKRTLAQDIQERRAVKISRKVVSDSDKTSLNLRLYQYQTCPFCCKVRAFLDYYGFNYEVVEVNPVTKAQLHFSSRYKKVPILVTRGERLLTESSLIVSILSTFLHRSNRSLDDVIDCYPGITINDPKTQKDMLHYPNKYFVMLEDVSLSDEQIQNAREEREWREWVDEHFVHLISPNVYRNWAESLATFRWFSEVGEWHNTFPLWERYLAVYAGAAVMLFVSKKLKKKHGIVDERAAIVDACNQWVAALGDRSFLGGDKPNLADLALFGAMNSFYGCAAFAEMLERTKIGAWFERMRSEVESRAGSALIRQRSG
uniref:Prostaglandin E synthase 2 n=2 Tax=Parascaris univalens TaxID=6257 RepID=A0A915BZD4_PARUN